MTSTTIEKIGGQLAANPQPTVTAYGISVNTTPPHIAEKLVKLLGMVGTIPKGGHNSKQNYDFVRETDLVEKVRPALAELGLFLNQDVVEHQQEELYKAQSGSTMFITRLAVRFTWIDISGEIWPVPGVTWGYGADTGDKGVYKAHTGAVKYFLMKTLLVSTGDDPEGDENVDKHAAAASAARGSRTTVTRGNQPGVERGGKSSVSTDAQRTELKRLARELGITTGTDLMALVGRIITGYGEEPPTWDTVAAFGEYLKGLDATRMGQLIVGAEGLVAAAKPNEGAPEGGTDDDLDLGYG